MLPRDTELSIADFSAVPWTEVISSAKEKVSESYADGFVARAKDAHKAGDTKTSAVYTLLYDVTSLHFKPESTDEPFGPLFVFASGRAAVVDDFNETQLTLFKELLPSVNDPETNARLADVLWVTKKDHDAARTAIDSYLESARALEDGANWVYCFERIERAVRLAASLGGGAPFVKAIGHAEEVLGRMNGEDPLYLSAKLMELLLEHRQGDAGKYAALAEKAADLAKSAGDLFRAETYWAVAAKWRRRAGDSVAERNAKIQAAETFVALAEERTKDPNKSYLVASSHLQSAIEAFRKIGGLDQKVKELHERLLAYQKLAMAELKGHSVPIDLSEVRDKAADQVKGKAFQDAILTLATLGKPQDVGHLRKRTKELIKKYPLQYFIQRTSVNKEGKVTGRPPAAGTAEGDDADEAIEEEMFHSAVMGQQIQAAGVIEPARRQIIDEHPCRPRCLAGLAENNPFIPPDRQEIFARGLHAGLVGDWMMAAHLLIPQVENSFRYFLTSRGVTTSKLNKDGIQDEMGLEELFDLADTKKLFGENLIFDLRGLLIERSGSYLRHRLAHGLLADDDMRSVSMTYFWWAILRIICVPFIPSTASGDEDPKNAFK